MDAQEDQQIRANKLSQPWVLIENFPGRWQSCLYQLSLTHNGVAIQTALTQNKSKWTKSYRPEVSQSRYFQYQE
jgi:hypothetical protein